MKTLAGIYIGTAKGKGKTFVESAELVAGHGLVGDIHAGQDERRQVSLFSQQLYLELLSEGFTLTPESLSANLFLDNIDIDRLVAGDKLGIGEAVVEIVEPRLPCKSITRINNRLPKRLFGQCGQMARVITGGRIKKEDIIEIFS